MSAENPGWADFTGEQLLRIAKMMDHAAYGNVTLNMNDTFAYACAWGTDVDEFDLLTVTELYEQYGIAGVRAWAAVKEGVIEQTDETKKNPLNTIPENSPEFTNVVNIIMSDLNKYFWLPRYRASKKEKTNA